MCTTILAKCNLNDIVKELNQAALTYEYLCLSKTQKWCNEMLFSLDNINIPEDSSIVNYYKIFGKDYKAYQLSKSYFNLKEYSRANYYLTKTTTPLCYFLSVYSKYMAIMKKCVDNKSDLFTNPDGSCLESLQTLRNELKLKYINSQLDAYSLYIYGLVLSKLKLNEDAINAFVDSVNKQPTLWGAWLELATLIRSIDTLNQLNHQSLPQHWIKDLFLAYCYMELSLSEEALNIYLEYSNKGFAKNIYIKSQIAKCYDNLREGQECKQTFEAIRKLDPFNLDYMDIYSNILFVLEEHAQLAILAQEACEIDKYRPESCCIIGNYYSLQNDHHKAVTYFQRALKLNPSYLQAWTLMGHEFMELKSSSAAIQSYTHAIELNPKDYRAWYGIGQTYEILKLYSYSLYYYKQVYLMRPNDSRFIVALADVYVKLDKLDEARRCYIKAYSVGDCEGNALCKLAKIYEKLNDPVNAAIAYDKYTQDQKALQGHTNLNNNGELSQAYRYLANYYLKKLRLDNAYEAAIKCLDFSETRLEAQSLLSQISQMRNAKEPEVASGTAINNTEMDIGSVNQTANLDNTTDTHQNMSDNSNNSVNNAKVKQAVKQSNAIDSDSESDTMFTGFHIKRFNPKKDV